MTILTKDEIIRMAKEAGCLGPSEGGDPNGLWEPNGWENVTELMFRFADLIAAAEREECARVCEEKQEYSMPISCPDGISGCLVAHYVPARREKTGNECAAAIRARGEK